MSDYWKADVVMLSPTPNALSQREAYLHEVRVERVRLFALMKGLLKTT